MQAAGIASYGSLARASLSHASWPVGAKVQERSLATMLSRFDRGIEVDWLSDRPVVQQVLAECLGCTVADIRAPLLRSNDAPQAPRRVRFEVLPQAQALDLYEEGLPPGIPTLLTIPSAWDRAVWLRRPGDGATLVGQWLDARGRAEVKRVRGWPQVLALPTVGPPLFVEILEPLCPNLDDWKPQRPVCLAAVQGESATAAWTQAGWDLVHSLPIETTLRPIISWVVQRIGTQASFDVDLAEEWIRESLVQTGIVETFGDVIGWCGHLAEFGLESTSRRSHRQLLNALLKRALAPLAKARDATASSWSRKVPELLIAMAEHSLLLPDADLLSARPLESWVELLPEQDRVGPDLDWMKTHLSTSKVIRARDLEKAAAQFPPGAHRWLGLLRDSGLLQPVNEQDYVLRPHYLARLCRHIANDSLIRGSSAVWGTALFHARSARAVWPELKHRVEINAEALADSVLDDLDEENAGTVLALEATMIAAGMSLLSGKEIPPTIAEQLIDESCALALEHPEQPHSLRIGLGTVDGVDSKTLWWLSLIGLAEMPNHARRARPAALDPWSQKSPPAELVTLLDSLVAQLSGSASSRPAWALGAFLMLERLRQTIGAVFAPTGRPHAALAPGIALDEIQHGVLEWESMVPLLENELLFDVFTAMAAQRRVTAAVWAESFWNAFEQSQITTDVHDFVARHTDLLSPHVPASLGLAWLDGVRPVPCEVILGAIPENIVLTWLDRRDANDAPLPAVVVQHAREELLERMLADLDDRDEALLPLFWDRVPHRVVSRLHRFRVMFPAKAGRWIDMAPVSQSKSLFKAASLDDWLKASRPLLLALRRYCLRCIDERSEHWQSAYNWLVRIERILRV